MKSKTWKIKSRYTGEVIFEGDDLTGANLSGAYLWNCKGNMEEVKSLQLETYNVTYTKDVLQIA